MTDTIRTAKPPQKTGSAPATSAPASSTNAPNGAPVDSAPVQPAPSGAEQPEVALNSKTVTQAPPSPPDAGAPSTQPPRLGLGLPPEPDAGGRPWSEADPELYAAWRKHIEQGFANNQLMFNRVLEAFMNPYYTTVWMYRILFGVGVVALVAAGIISVVTGQQMAALVTAGLGVAAIVSYFLSRPLQALEENLLFITWLGIIYNTYWARLANITYSSSTQADIDSATRDAIAQLSQLVDKHTELTGKRPNLQ